MVFARIAQNVVAEIIPEFDSAFPGVPVGERYPADVIKKLVAVEDEESVHVGMVYDASTGEFSEPEPAEPPTPAPKNLDEAKALKIAESKVKLAEWLGSNPMLYDDGKLYSVTAEKQSLLNNNLTSYERAVEAGVSYPLKWNASGEECVEWTYEDLVALSLAIAAYVAPKVAMQQAAEIEINACETAEQLAEVIVDYDG